MTEKKKRLGDLLVEAGLIDQFQLNAALGHQKKWGGRVGSNLISLGFISEQKLIEFFSKQMGYSSVNLSNMKISPNIIKKVPKDIAEKYNVIPVGIKEDVHQSQLILAMSDPTNLLAVDEIRFLVNMNIQPVVALHSAIIKAIGAHYWGTVHDDPDFVKDEASMRQSIEIDEDKTGDGMIFYGIKKKEPIPAKVEGSKPKTDLPRVDKESRWMRALIKLLLKKGIINQEELIREVKGDDK